MTDLNKLRSEFEGIPEIKAHLDHGNVFWSDKNQTYASEFQCLHAVACYVNGAWFMFQEKAKAQAVPEWISVDDKWPEYGQSTLVVISGQTQTRVFFRDGSDRSKDWIEPVNDDDCHNTICWEKVTHWMPLPKAPSESGAEQ
ncbi:DUF551 domain-containing protein [Acinetobacter baumannii]|nr:DUF551 domain-containing protein [Acinetobacter baumannii]